jgi:hypothetical protein
LPVGFRGNWGGGIISTILIFIVIYYLLGHVHC